MEKKYYEIYDRIKKGITEGVYPYGTKLPSKRVTAENSGFSVITVEHAYELLVSEGYIEPKNRSGYYVSYVSGETFGSVKAAEKPVTEFGGLRKFVPAGEPFPFSVYASAVRFVLSEYGERLYEKSPNSGTDELREAIREYLARNRRIYVKKENIVVGSGAEYLYGIITELLGRDKVYGIEDPSYEKIERVYEANGVSCRKLKLGEEGIISSELANTDAQVLHVTPFRSFPTGVTASASKKREYLEWAANGNRFIVEDDYESEFSLSPKTVDTIFAADGSGRTIYLNTFSNTLSPALRVGYMLLSDELSEKFAEELGFYSCSVPVLEQYLIARLLNDGSFERHLNRVRRNRKRL